MGEGLHVGSEQDCVSDDLTSSDKHITNRPTVRTPDQLKYRIGAVWNPLEVGAVVDNDIGLLADFKGTDQIVDTEGLGSLDCEQLERIVGAEHCGVDERVLR